MKQVIIVNEGQWGTMRRGDGDYDSFTGELVSLLEKRSPQGTSVKSVNSTEEALQRITLGSISETVIVFTTRAMIGKAEEIAENNRQIRVVVLTGLPEDLGKGSSVVVLDKGMPVGGGAELVKAILGS